MPVTGTVVEQNVLRGRGPEKKRNKCEGAQDKLGLHHIFA